MIPNEEVPTATPEAIVEQFSGWVKYLAKRYSTALERTGAVDDQDLYQTGILALLKAQETYDPGKGYGFLRHSQYLIRNAMRRELGFDPHTGEMPAPPVSLDEPLNEDSDDTRKDFVPDSTPTAEETIVDRDGHQETADAVRAAVNRLKNPKQREVITRCWLDGQPKREAAAEMGIGIRSLQMVDLEARQKLRRDRQLKEFATPYFHHVGVSQFQSTWTSATEWAVLWREEHLSRS